MKNSLFSISLFIVLFIFLFYTDYKFKNICSEVVNSCEEMEYELFIENKDKNFDDSIKIFTLLKDGDTIPSIYVNHIDYDTLLNEALKLSVYIETEDYSEAETSLHILKFNADRLKAQQIPNLKNIF